VKKLYHQPLGIIVCACKEATMVRRLPSAVYVALACIVSVVLIVPSFHYPVSDDAFFVLVGREMISGRALYLGWDNKPPAIYAVNAILQFAFGDHYILHRLVQYGVTLTSIGVFAAIVRRSCPRTWAAATLMYALLVSWPTTAFLNYTQQYAMLPMLLAVLFAMRGRPIEAGVMHALAIMFWQPAIFVAAAVLLWLVNLRRSTFYLAFLIGSLVVAAIVSALVFSPASMRELLHDMTVYQGLRTHLGFGDIRVRFLAALVITGLIYPLIVLAAVLKRPETRVEVAATVWFGTALAGAVTNLNFSSHYFYPVIAPTVYTIFLFGEQVVWSRQRIGLAVVAALIALALIPRTIITMRHILADEGADLEASERIGSVVRKYVPVGGEILVYGYLPAIYLRAERNASGRYANYLALRRDTVSASDRTTRLATYAEDVVAVPPLFVFIVTRFRTVFNELST
jgi:hypothetical protein